MLSGLYSAATGVYVAQLRQQVIAENLANLDVPGYRRQLLAMESLEPLNYGAIADGVIEWGVQAQEVHRDFSVGQIQHTGRKLDAALDGSGFFVVQTPEGEAYTRNGVFFTAADGTLMTAAGYPVQGVGGPIQLPPQLPADSIVITREGALVGNGVPLGQLEVVDFLDLTDLEAVGAALFRPPAGVTPIAPERVSVQQGFRELSNVSATSELVNMLIGVRQHEASQRALTTIAEAISRHINQEGG